MFLPRLHASFLNPRKGTELHFVTEALGTDRYFLMTGQELGRELVECAVIHFAQDQQSIRRHQLRLMGISTNRDVRLRDTLRTRSVDIAD